MPHHGLVPCPNKGNKVGSPASTVFHNGPSSSSACAWHQRDRPSPAGLVGFFAAVAQRDYGMARHGQLATIAPHRQLDRQSVISVQTNLRRAISAIFFPFFFFSLPQTVPLQCDACLPCQACEEANEPVPVPCLTCLIACVCEVLQHVCMARSLALQPQLSQHSTNPCTLGTMTSL